MKREAPNYLINLIPKYEVVIRTRNSDIPTYNCRIDCFKYSFFPSTLNDWFRFDINIRNAESNSLFKSSLQIHCSKVVYYLSFVQIRVTYLIILTQLA